MRISLALLAAACTLAASPAPAQVNVAGADTSNVWSYSGPAAPEHWTRLGYPECSGARQSPVDLSADGSRPALGVSVEYPAWPAAVAYNNGHTVVVNRSAPGTLTVGAGWSVPRRSPFRAPRSKRSPRRWSATPARSSREARSMPTP